MIKILNQNDFMDVKLLLQDNGDLFVTKNNQRISLSKSESELKKALKNQICFGVFEDGLVGIGLILKEKGFRTFLKICSSNKKAIKDILKYFIWNYCDSDIYVKEYKHSNFNHLLSQYEKASKPYMGFKFMGYRAEPHQEVLWHREKTEKPIMTAKDADDDEYNSLYHKEKK